MTTRCPRLSRHAFILSTAILLTACGGGSPLTSSDTLLRYVPADTPYVVAAVEPLPDEIWDITAEQMEAMWNFFQMAMQEGLEVNIAAGGPEADALALLSDLASPESFEAMGFTRDSEVVVYGYGLLPVLRVTLADDHDFQSVFDRLDSLFELQDEVAFATGSIGERAYRYIAADPARIIIAVLDNELVVTAVPVTFSDADLESVLGIQLPDQSIAESGRLADIADEYDYTPHFVALFDTERTAETFLGQPGATDQALFDLAGYSAQSISAVCRDEMRDLAGVAPAIVGGYTEINSEVMAMSMVIELRGDIAAGLARIPAPVPGMGAATDALVSFGVSFDIPAMRDFVEARSAALQADPFQCDDLSELSAAVAEWRQVLNQQVPPVVDDIHGLNLSVDIGDLNIADLAALPSVLQDAQIAAVLATDDVAGVLGMASLLDPQFAALDLGNNGQAVEVQMPFAITGGGPNPYGALYMAATENALGISLGQDSDATLEEMIDAPPGDSSTFFSMSLDLARYYGMLAESMDQIVPVAAPQPVAFTAAMTELMRGMQDAYSRETYEVRFTERGIEMPVVIELAQ